MADMTNITQILPNAVTHVGMARRIGLLEVDENPHFMTRLLLRHHESLSCRQRQ